MTNLGRALFAGLAALAVAPGSAPAQLIYDPCLRPGPDGEAVRLRPCSRPLPGVFTDFPELRGDFPREIRGWSKVRRCVRMTRHVFLPERAPPEAGDRLIARIEQWGFRVERRRNGAVAAYAPLVAGGPTGGDIALHFAGLGEEYRYAGWEFAPVSGCR